MKTSLTNILRTLFFPLLWCRMVLQEASRACVDCDPRGYSDYLCFTAPQYDNLPSPLENAANQTFCSRVAASRRM